MARDGKRIDKWKVYADGRVAEVTVYLVASTHSGQSFRAECDEHDLLETGTDIAELRKKVETVLTERLAVPWVPKIHVELTAPATHEDWPQRGGGWKLRARLELHAEAYEVSTVNGKEQHRSGGSVSRYELRVGREEGSRSTYGGDPHGATTCALIDDTPENRAALLRIEQGMVHLAEGLSKFLEPAAIQATLARLLAGGTTLGLPATASSDEAIPPRRAR